MTTQRRYTPKEKERATATAVRLYRKGQPIRDIAEALDRSYGWVHRALREAEVEFRPRGGYRRRTAK